MSSSNLPSSVVKWQKVHGRHNLPWQTNPSPYRVWVSEIMLQQTQVSTVIPYYQKLMTLCPTVKDLANLPLDTLLFLWQGLGYYSRARNLHRAARIIEEKGYFPDTLETLMTLPGIGESTAAAILSLAYNQPAAILDGNVKRVFSRYFGVNLPPKEALKPLWTLAKENISSEPRIYTQGLMDLGASLCKRTQPKCSLCPLSNTCYAYKYNMVDTLPQKAIKPPKQQVNLYILISIKDRHIGLVPRPEKGIWAKLYTPIIYSTSSEIPKNATPLKSYQHQLTHKTLHIYPFYTTDTYPIDYWPLDNLSVAIPTGIQKGLNSLLKHLEIT